MKLNNDTVFLNGIVKKAKGIYADRRLNDDWRFSEPRIESS
ncbi:MAG: hypothetical protein AAFR63_06610 [Cyanobacteria bacterium J06631_6]